MGLARTHKLVLGFAHWGKEQIPVEEMLRIVKHATQQGIDEIDCAPHYGNGAQENVLGVALLMLPQSIRDKIKISTKVGRIMDPRQKSENNNGFTNSTNFKQEFNYSKSGIEDSFHDSQLRLQLSMVHALYLHDLDKETHGNNYEYHYYKFMADGYTALDSLKAQGKTVLVGIGSNDIDLCIQLIHDGRYRINRILLAGRYNLLDQSALETLFPLCKEKGIELYLAAPYCSGILSEQVNNQAYKYAEASSEIKDRVAKLRSICDKHGVSLAHAAMQFVHLHPQASRVVVGARTVEELDKSLQYARQLIKKEFWDELKQEKLIPEQTVTTSFMSDKSPTHSSASQFSRQQNIIDFVSEDNYHQQSFTAKL